MKKNLKDQLDTGGLIIGESHKSDEEKKNSSVTVTVKKCFNKARLLRILIRWLLKLADESYPCLLDFLSSVSYRFLQLFNFQPFPQVSVVYRNWHSVIVLRLMSDTNYLFTNLKPEIWDIVDLTGRIADSESVSKSRTVISGFNSDFNRLNFIDKSAVHQIDHFRTSITYIGTCGSDKFYRLYRDEYSHRELLPVMQLSLLKHKRATVRLVRPKPLTERHPKIPADTNDKIHMGTGTFRKSFFCGKFLIKTLITESSPY